MILTCATKTPFETETLAAALAPMLVPGDALALVGELGAGKTCFVRGLARGLGLDPALVSSPTFVLVNEYPPTHPSDPPLVHVDAYRLDMSADLEAIGLSSDVMTSAILVVEWADRIFDQLSPDHLRIEIEHVDAERRRLTLTAPELWLDAATTTPSRAAALRDIFNQQSSQA